MPARAWSEAEVGDHLAASVIPLRLAVNGARGAPVVLSLWFVPDGLDLWCASADDSRVVRLVGRDGRVGFEVAGDRPPYRGARGQGSATLHPEQGAAVLDRLLDRYAIRRDSRLARFLLSRADREVAIRVEATRWTTWDYSARMQDAV